MFGNVIKTIIPRYTRLETRVRNSWIKPQIIDRFYISRTNILVRQIEIADGSFIHKQFRGETDQNPRSLRYEEFVRLLELNRPVLHVLGLFKGWLCLDNNTCGYVELLVNTKSGNKMVLAYFKADEQNKPKLEEELRKRFGHRAVINKDIFEIMR